MADEKTAPAAQPATIHIDTDPGLPNIPIDTETPTYDPTKDQRPTFLKVQTHSRGPQIEAAPEPGVVEKVERAVTEGIPRYSSRTPANPKYGQEQFLSPEELLTPQQQREHPIFTGALETAGGLTSPSNIALGAATGDAGVISKAASALFAGMAAKGVYDQYPALKDAVDKGDQAETERLLTHMGLDTVMAIAAGKHAVEGGVSEKLSQLGTHLNAAGKTLAEDVKASAQRALEAKAPEGSLEAGFAKIGGKPVKRAVKTAPKAAVSFDSIGGQEVKPAAPESRYHPDLQKVTELPGVTVHQDPSQITEGAHFITPDGKFVRLPAGLDHDAAINQVRPDQMEYDPRINFINDTGAVRVRPTVDRAGQTLHVSVPESGVTPEQMDALKQSVGQGMKSRGNMILETAAEPRDIETTDQETVSPRHIEPMLKQIGAHPEQAETPALKISTDKLGVKWAEDENGIRVSIPKRITDADVQAYAADKIKEQAAGQAAVKAKSAEAAPPAPEPNETLQKSAQKYAKAQGMEPINHEPVKVDPERAKEIANIYDKAQHDPENPRVKAAYDAFKKETLAQFHHLRDDLGLKFEPQKDDPYNSAGEMMNDIKQNNRLKVFTGSSTGPDHPLSKVAPGTGGQTYNTVFRWVHDAMGHAAGGHDFSEAGEKSATEAHAQMYGDIARPAMRAETEGQTSWFFHNPEVESGAKRPGQFAEQKATILPDTSADWHEKAGASAAKNEAGGINPRTGKSDSKGMGTEIMPELRQNLDHAPTAQDFKNFYDQHKDIFDAHPELRVGWDNNSAVPGGHEINVGAVGPDAARVAKKLDQQSAFNIAKGEVVPTGGTGLRTSFPNYPIEERIKDLTNQPHSDRPGFEHISDEIYKNLEPDERKYIQGNKNLQRNVMAQYHKIAPSINETTNAMQAGAALGGWWQRYIDTFHGLMDTDAEKVANTIGPSHAEILKQWHAAVSGNKSVQDANNLAWHSYADWLDAGKPTDRKAIDDIVRKNAAQPEGSEKRGNAAISDTRGPRGKLITPGLDTTKLYNLINSPEMRGERPFSGDVFNNDAKNPLMGSTEGARKIPSMGATVAGKGNLNRLVIDAHIRDFYGHKQSGGPAAQYIADSVHLRQAAKALGLKGGEGQEQLWGTVLGLKSLLKEGLTPEEAGSKLDAETINKIGKDYAEVIANDPEITQPGGLLDRLKEKYGIGVGSAGASAADIAARSARAGEGQSAGSEASVDQALLGESARRIRGQISESKIKKPAAPAEDEDTSFNFGANEKPATPAPPKKVKPSKTMSAIELIQALGGLSKPGSKK